MKLDKHSSIPLYAQLKDLLLNRIQQGVYAPGLQIPSELALCAELELSRPTVRQAISELVSEGTLYIEKGKGTFVAPDPERIELQRFQAFTFSFLLQNSLDQMLIRQVQRLSTDESLEKEFGADVSTAGFWQVDWVLRNRDTVYGWCRVAIPVMMFPNLAEDLEKGKQMLDIVANKYAYLPQKGQLRMLVRAATDEEASQLDISRRSPVLSARSCLTSRSGHICEVVSVVFRPDLVEISQDSGRS